MAGPELLHSDVSRAMDQLKSSGHVPRVDSVAALLEGRGSRALIIRLMAEVIAAEAALLEFDIAMPAPTTQMRLVTDDSGSGNQAAKDNPLENSMDALVADSEATLGCSKAVFDKIEHLEAERDELLAEIKKCHVQIAKLQPSESNSKLGGTDPTKTKEIFGL